MSTRKATFLANKPLVAAIAAVISKNFFILFLFYISVSNLQIILIKKQMILIILMENVFCSQN
jgi:hypothetical protein